MTHNGHVELIELAAADTAALASSAKNKLQHPTCL